MRKQSESERLPPLSSRNRVPCACRGAFMREKHARHFKLARTAAIVGGGGTKAADGVEEGMDTNGRSLPFDDANEGEGNSSVRIGPFYEDGDDDAETDFLNLGEEEEEEDSPPLFIHAHIVDEEDNDDENLLHVHSAGRSNDDDEPEEDDDDDYDAFYRNLKARRRYQQKQQQKKVVQTIATNASLLPSKFQKTASSDAGQPWVKPRYWCNCDEVKEMEEREDGNLLKPATTTASASGNKYEEEEDVSTTTISTEQLRRPLKKVHDYFNLDHRLQRA